MHSVVLTAKVNAAVTTYGIRRRRLLFIGLGLWEIVTPQQRIALLGHYANGDARHGLIISSALRTLATWAHIVSPMHGGGFALLFNMI